MVYRENDYLITAADLALPAPEFPFVERGLQQVCEHSGGDLDVEAVLADAYNGVLKNLFVYDLDMNILGFVLYHVNKANYDVTVNMHILAMYVAPNHKQATDVLISFIKTLAPMLGAAKIIGISQRKGWARRMKPDKLLQLGVWHGKG
jgi:hypothetical protein